MIGLVSNVVASLYAIRWLPLTYFEWHAPNGVIWNIPSQLGFSFHDMHLIRSIQDDAVLSHWAAAQHHYNGKGLASGFSHAYSMTLLRRWRKEKIFDRAAALETMMCAACWSPQRRYDAGLIPASENVCPQCQQSGAGDLHQFWTCPALHSSAWPEIANTQHYVSRATNETNSFPCLWLRGLLPADMCLPHPIPKPLEEDVIYLFDPHSLFPDPHVWPAGLYGTDASGGKYGRFPELRRCGCSAVRMSSLDDPFEIDGLLRFHSSEKCKLSPGQSCTLLFLSLSKFCLEMFVSFPIAE